MVDVGDFRQYQQRVPYELLSGLANCLLNETIFKIVEGLTEIQQVTEKQLLQGRLQLLQKHRTEKEAIPEGTEGRDEVIQKQAEELKKADMSLILQVNAVVIFLIQGISLINLLIKKTI